MTNQATRNSGPSTSLAHRADAMHGSLATRMSHLLRQTSFVVTTTATTTFRIVSHILLTGGGARYTF